MNLKSVTFSLPEDLVEKAIASGLLTDAHVAAWLEDELKRQEGWKRFRDMVSELQEAAAEDFGHMSEDEIMEMVVKEVKEVREERYLESLARKDSGT